MEAACESVSDMHCPLSRRFKGGVCAGVIFVLGLASCGGGTGTSAPGSTYTPAGNAATVMGVDSAGRGYRDDVLQLIHDKYSSVPVVRANAEAAARDYQKSISPDTLAMSDTSSVVQESAQSARCMAALAGWQYGLQVEAAIKAVYARTFNTDARLAARLVFVKAAKSVVILNYDPAKCGSIR